MSKTSDRQMRRRRRSKPAEQGGGPRRVNYRQLKCPFAPQRVFSDDQVAGIHQTALRVLEELGVKMLLAEGRKILQRAGAIVDHDSQMVRIGKELVDEALSAAPRSFVHRARNPQRDQVFEQGAMIFGPGGGCPNATDAERGRRPGSLRDFEETTRLHQSFDVIHMLGHSAEPQDVPVHLRHYAMMRAHLTLSDKPLSIYSRGSGQTGDSFEMIRLAAGLNADEFAKDVWCMTVINSNSPRLFDNPMTQGIIDFARAGQMSIITPFCLAGAMAPISIAGALTLQHAEALAGIALAQFTRPGAPVCNGGFSSNVDMKSGSPAFGTPEHVKLTLGAGQLARHIGLPWRSAMGTSSNVSDAQAASETLMSGWATLLAGATFILHSAGWLEGGLTFGYEKMINDVEALQTFAELCAPVPGAEDDMGFRAISDVEPGGHFFATAHTLERYQSAFYEPLVADTSNHGTWLSQGGHDATMRATKIWQTILNDFVPPPVCEGVDDALAAFIEKRTKQGGAPLMS